MTAFCTISLCFFYTLLLLSHMLWGDDFRIQWITTIHFPHLQQWASVDFTLLEEYELCNSKINCLQATKHSFHVQTKFKLHLPWLPVRIFPELNIPIVSACVCVCVFVYVCIYLKVLEICHILIVNMKEMVLPEKKDSRTQFRWVPPEKKPSHHKRVLPHS